MSRPLAPHAGEAMLTRALADHTLPIRHLAAAHPAALIQLNRGARGRRAKSDQTSSSFTSRLYLTADFALNLAATSVTRAVAASSGQ